MAKVPGEPRERGRCGIKNVPRVFDRRALPGYSKPPLAPELLALLDCRCAALVEIEGKVVELDALRAFLRSFHSDGRKRDIAGRYLADELVGGSPKKSLSTSSAEMIGRPAYIAIAVTPNVHPVARVVC